MRAVPERGAARAGKKRDMFQPAFFLILLLAAPPDTTRKFTAPMPAVTTQRHAAQSPPDTTRNVAAPIAAPEPFALFDGGGFDAFPSLERSKNGAWLCSFRAASAHVSSDGRICLGRSVDGGRTWTTSVIYDDPRTDDRVDLGLTSLADGTLFLPFYQRDEERATGCFFLRSTDEGSTWQGPMRIPSVFSDWMAMYGRAVESEDGALLVPAYGQDREGPSRTVLLQSMDRGATWSQRSVIASGEASYNECDVIATGGRRLLAVVRRETFPAELCSAVSEDEGRTWSRPRALFDGVSPSLARLENGELLLASSDRLGAGGIRLSLSGDGGATWERSVLVDAGSEGEDLGYPTCLPQPDGSIFIAYYQRGGNIRGAFASYAFIGSNPSFHDSDEDFEEPLRIRDARIWRLAHGRASTVRLSEGGRAGGHALRLEDRDTDDRPSAIRTLYAFARPEGTVTFWLLPQALVNGMEFGLLAGPDAVTNTKRFWFRITPSGAIERFAPSPDAACAAPAAFAPRGTVPAGKWTEISIRYRSAKNEAFVLVNGIEMGRAAACDSSGEIAHLGFVAGTQAGTGDAFLIDDLSTRPFVDRGAGKAGPKDRP